MRFFNFTSLPYKRKLLILKASALIEACAAVLFISLALSAILRLEYKSRRTENIIRNKLKNELKENSTENLPCKESANYSGIKLFSCKGKYSEKFFISGFTTLEVVLSLALITPCLISLIILTSAGYKNLKQTKNEKIETYNIIRISHIFNNVINEIDGHPFNIKPKIHKSGVIRFYNGKSSPINKLKNDMRPHPDSDALTYMRANVEDTLEVYSVDISQKTFFACARFNTQLSRLDYKSILLIDSENIYEAGITDIKPEVQNGIQCAEIKIQIPQSMLFPGIKTEDLIFIRHVVPVESIYTIYIDKKRTLRYIGHRSGINIENQPMLDKAPLLKIRLSTLPQAIYSLQLELKSIYQNVRINLSNKIVKTSILNFSLNTP